MKVHLVSVDNKIAGYVEPGSMLMSQLDGADYIGALQKISDFADSANEFRIAANKRSDHKKFDGKVAKVSGGLTEWHQAQ